MDIYKHPWYVTYTYSVLRFLIKPIVSTIWIKEVTGIERIPTNSAVILAFNHQSYLDFISFMVVCPRQIHFLAAEKFFSHLFWSPLMKLSGQIKVERKSHEKELTHKIINSHLATGKAIGIFPEGTRSHSRNDMLHAFTGVSKFAVKAGVPVIPVGIKGTYDILSRHDSFPKFKKVISIHVGSPIYFTEHHHKELDESVHRELTDKIMFELSNLSGKTYHHYGKLIHNKSISDHIPTIML